MYFRIPWVTLEQSQDCPSASDHYSDVTMSAMVSQITGLVSSMSHRASLATARGIHLWNCWTVVCMKCIILYSSGNKITKITTGVSIVCSIVCSGADQREHQCSASLAFVTRIHRSPVYSPHKGPVMRKMFPFDDLIMATLIIWSHVDRRKVI